MGAFQTLMALVVLIFVLSAIVWAVQEVLKLLSDSNGMTMAKTALWLGIFVLLALPIAQCQTANATPPAPDKKACEKKATDKKAADKKSTVKNAGPGAPQGNPPAVEGSKADAEKATPAVRLENARLDAVDSDYANMSLRDCVSSQPDPTKIVCNGKVYHPKVNDKGLRAQLKQFHVGDHIRVDIFQIPGGSLVVGGDVDLPRHYRIPSLARWMGFLRGSQHPAESSSAFRIERHHFRRSKGDYDGQGRRRSAPRKSPGGGGSKGGKS